MQLPNNSIMTDEQLVQACLDLKAAAQKQLYDRFARKMFGVCLRYANSREEAEDFLQDGFVKVFQKLSSYKGAGSLEGWIRRVIVNTVLDHLRQQKLSFTSSTAAEEVQAQEGTLGRMQVQELLKLIQALPKGFRTIFNLYAIEGYNHREIGELLGISENTSKSQYARARAHLETAVSQNERQSSNAMTS